MKKGPSILLKSNNSCQLGYEISIYFLRYNKREIFIIVIAGKERRRNLVVIGCALCINQEVLCLFHENENN